MKKLALALAATAVLASPVAMAESAIVSGAAPSTATSRLDFQITIPRVLFLQVGTGTVGAVNATIDLVTFAPTAAQLLTATNIAATANGTVTVRVAGNNGPIVLSAAAAGQIGNGTSTIPWTELAITAATVATPATGFTSPAAIAHPTLSAAGATTASVSLGAANTAIRREGTWTFAYANSALYAPGTYGGVNVNNSRMTYTATMP